LNVDRLEEAFSDLMRKHGLTQAVLVFRNGSTLGSITFSSNVLEEAVADRMNAVIYEAVIKNRAIILHGEP